MSQDPDIKPQATDAAPRGQIFLEDIFIVRRAGEKSEIFRLREENWKRANPRSEEALRDPEIARLLPLIRNEVVVANVPPLPDPEQPAQKLDAYVFINLTALAVNKD